MGRYSMNTSYPQRHPRGSSPPDESEETVKPGQRPLGNDVKPAHPAKPAEPTRKEKKKPVSEA